MSFEERLLAGRGGHPVHRLAGERQPQREQVDLGHFAGQHGVELPEVHLRLGAGKMRLRHEHRLRPQARLPPHLRTSGLHVEADHRIRDVAGAVLVDQPIEDSLSSVPLLGRRIQVRLQHAVDQRLVGIQP
ncbi:hypothetical protein AB0C81_04760 [Streptomyces roseoverticillatus]|uniref:hypothetical protein n=1 Tax=Streptomyces roseoverticillatus TaxID=66429 RepID=UPI00340066F0